MASNPKSRWDNDDANDSANDAELARLKAEKKEAKRRTKEARRAAATAAAITPTGLGTPSNNNNDDNNNNNAQQQQQLAPPSKRRKLDGNGNGNDSDSAVGNIDVGTQSPPPQSLPLRLLRLDPALEIAPCRHVDNYELLNHIEEGSYGIVSRARETATGEIVALKKLKLERERDGFPITSLREIRTLLTCKHPNVVNLREVVMGDRLDQVYLVMDFIEHDLKTLSDSMHEPFLQSEIKTLLLQLVSATALMHSHWIVHRDLKTSNLLMNNRGQIKVADFGLARFTGDPRPPLTQLVVTLWYRSPELLLGAKEYGPEVDMWSIGCIFGELLSKEPILQGKTEVDQISKIFALLGVPTESSWPSFRRLPHAKSLTFPRTQSTTSSLLRTRFPLLTNAGIDLLSRLLALDPAKRISAEDVLQHHYFCEDPKPKREEMFPTFPSKAGGERRRRHDTPGAPRGGVGEGGWDEAADSDGKPMGILVGRDAEEVGGGFMLKLAR